MQKRKHFDITCASCGEYDTFHGADFLDFTCWSCGGHAFMEYDDMVQD